MINEFVVQNLEVNRTVYNQKKFDVEFLTQKVNIQNSGSEKKRLVKIILKNILKFFDPRKLITIFSIFNVINEYDLKNYLVADVFSGITVGIMQIPQVILFFFLIKFLFSLTFII